MMTVKVHKFHQRLRQKDYDHLEKIAISKGISVQQLLRVFVIPEWLKDKTKVEN